MGWIPSPRFLFSKFIFWWLRVRLFVELSRPWELYILWFSEVPTSSLLGSWLLASFGLTTGDWLDFFVIFVPLSGFFVYCGSFGFEFISFGLFFAPGGRPRPLPYVPVGDYWVEFYEFYSGGRSWTTTSDGNIITWGCNDWDCSSNYSERCFVTLVIHFE